MYRACQIACVVSLGVICAFAGDDASGSIPYSVDLSAPYSRHELSAEDRQWGASLVANLGYDGKVVYFVRTTLPLQVDKATVTGEVYQAIESPDWFYVVPGDAMLKIGTRFVASPGVGGFSMHAPRSRDFIVCLNCGPGGVPFLSSTKVSKGLVTWGGDSWDRFSDR